MAKKFLVSPGRCYVVTGPVGTTITAKDGTIVNSIVTGSTQCSFIPSVNEVTVDPDTAKLEQVSRGIAVRSSNNGGGGGGSTGNDWITVNDAGEAVLNFPENRDLPIKFGYSDFTKITGTLGGKLNANYMFYNSENASNIELKLPESKSAYGICWNCLSAETVRLIATNAADCTYAFRGCGKMTDLYIVLPSAINMNGAFIDCTYFITAQCNFASMSTLDFTSTSGTGGLGNVPSLENVTVLDGGLASCTSFIITNSTNLTDESIQNIIDALPDYSGTETSALVSFPPDRLTTEQQEQLTNKGWTWS